MKERTILMTKNYREEIADFFILALDEDPIEFVKGWNFSQTGSPINSFTDKEYSGINKLYLKIIEVKMVMEIIDGLHLNKSRTRDIIYKKVLKVPRLNIIFHMTIKRRNG